MRKVLVGLFYNQKQNTDFTASTLAELTNTEQCYKYLC